MGFDELDDLLDPDGELEAAFRELDAQIKMDEMRRQGRSAQSSTTGRKRSTTSKRTGTTRKNTTRDPLKDLKEAFDGKASSPKAKPKAKTKPKAKAKGPAKRYLVVVCPGCSGKNRVPLERLRKQLPVCGRCKVDLSFERR